MATVLQNFIIIKNVTYYDMNDPGRNWSFLNDKIQHIHITRSKECLILFINTDKTLQKQYWTNRTNFFPYCHLCVNRKVNCLKMSIHSEPCWNTLEPSCVSKDGSSVVQRGSVCMLILKLFTFRFPHRWWYGEKKYCGNITKPNTSNTELIVFGDTLPLMEREGFEF